MGGALRELQVKRMRAAAAVGRRGIGAALTKELSGRKGALEEKKRAAKDEGELFRGTRGGPIGWDVNISTGNALQRVGHDGEGVGKSCHGYVGGG